jgi:hypothetical protein
MSPLLIRAPLRLAALAALTVGAGLSGACTRSLIPLTGTLVPVVATATLPSEEGPSPQPTEAVVADRTYAVVWASPESGLEVRQPAGISGSLVDTLPADLRGIQGTGMTTSLGSSLWIEIERPGGGKGWVNGWNLTEDVQPGRFCADGRVTELLGALREAVQKRDGQALEALVSPEHGLVIRQQWWDIEVRVPPEAVSGLFTSSEDLTWGSRRGSGAAIQGTFSAVILGELDEIFGGVPQVSCDSLTIGETARTPRWPAEYANLNYYTYFVPPAQGSSAFTWRAWAVGVEYVDGRPTIVLLVHYQGEI